MLPLIGLNKSSFGIGNFINSYVDETNEFIIVEMLQITNVVKVHQYFKFHFIKDSITYCVFQVPEEHRKAVELFRKGKYSQFPTESKMAIIKKSGLKYRVPSPKGTLITARELLALEKDKTLKNALEDELAVKIDANAELASIPDDIEFFDLHLSNELAAE